MWRGRSGRRASISEGGVQSGHSAFRVIVFVPAQRNPGLATPDAISQRPAAALDEVKKLIARIDQDRAGTLWSRVPDLLSSIHGIDRGFDGLCDGRIGDRFGRRVNGLLIGRGSGGLIAPRCSVAPGVSRWRVAHRSGAGGCGARSGHVGAIGTIGTTRVALRRSSADGRSRMRSKIGGVAACLIAAIGLKGRHDLRVVGRGHAGSRGRSGLVARDHVLQKTAAVVALRRWRFGALRPGDRRLRIRVRNIDVDAGPRADARNARTCGRRMSHGRENQYGGNGCGDPLGLAASGDDPALHDDDPCGEQIVALRAK